MCNLWCQIGALRFDSELVFTWFLFRLLSDKPRGTSGVDQIGDECGATAHHKERISFPDGGGVSEK
jgi:hypothetical protein